MFKSRSVKIGLVIFIISLFSAVCAYTHSGRTDSSGGHNDYINGGYHYHHGPGILETLIAIAIIIVFVMYFFMRRS